MKSWRSKVFAIILALVAISAFSATADAAPHHHHRRHHHHHHHAH